MYVTPDRFRTMGLGIDLTDLDEVAIRSSLHRASAIVDAYCSVPVLPQRFDFRGGIMTDEQHVWKIDPYDRPAPYRFYPWAQPVKEVTQFRIYSTPQVFTEIPPDNIFINNSAGWIEVSSLELTQFGIFGTGVVTTLIGMYNPVAVASYSYGWEIAEVDEILEETDAGVFRAQNQFWVSGSVEVKKNGAVQTTGFTLDLTEGTVTFTNLLAADDVVTASYSHTLPWQIAHATALIAADDMGLADLNSKGMSGVESLAVGEITIRRAAPSGQRGGTMVAEALPTRVQALLNNFVFYTAR